jgi:tRNA(Ile)-lysidine synthase
MLCAEREASGLTVIAAHLNHSLRGEESDGDQRFVEEICERWGVPLRVQQAHVLGLAKEHKLTLEEAGRQCRYAFFNALLRETGAQKIAVAHNLNDNAETVVLNLARGTGLTGLTGIPARRGNIVRPLINTSRAEIEKYLNENNIPFRTDATNLSGEFARGRVRNFILPALIENVNGNAVGNIARSGAILRAEDEYMGQAAERVYERVKILHYSKFFSHPVVLNAAALSAEHPAIIRRVLRLAYADCNRSVKDLSAPHVEQAFDILRGTSGRQANLPGVTVRMEYGRLIFEKPAREKATLSKPGSSEANLSGEANGIHSSHGSLSLYVPLEWGRPVYVSALNKTFVTGLGQPCKILENTCTKLFRYDTLKSVLILRTRRPGDRITLPGGTRKLQDYFTDKKIPRTRRDNIPLLTDGGQVLWIMDEPDRVNERYKPAGGESTFYVSVTSSSQPFEGAYL